MRYCFRHAVANNETSFAWRFWLFVLVLVLVVFAFGTATGAYVVKRNLLPSRLGEFVRMLNHKWPSGSSTLEEQTLMTADQVEALLTLHSAADIMAGRERLKRQLRGAACLFDSKVSNVNGIDRIDDKSISSRSGDAITVKLPLGITVVSRYFKSEAPSQTLLIYRTGHSGQTSDDRRNISRFLKSGVDVVVIDMPLIGNVNPPVVTIPNVGTIRLTQHNQLSLVETEDFNPMMLFVEPTACLINHLSSVSNYERIVQVGFSGGGFASTLSAAIDPRITKTYSVAGQTPVFLRSLDRAHDWGDYEQRNPELLKHFSDLDLYLMAASGTGRTYIQAFNEFDTCCFAGRRFEIYSRIIQERAHSIGAGKFEVWLDSNNFSHSISEKTIAAIHRDFIQEASSVTR